MCRAIMCCTICAMPPHAVPCHHIPSRAKPSRAKPSHAMPAVNHPAASVLQGQAVRCTSTHMLPAWHQATSSVHWSWRKVPDNQCLVPQTAVSSHKCITFWQLCWQILFRCAFNVCGVCRVWKLHWPCLVADLILSFLPGLLVSVSRFLSQYLQCFPVFLQFFPSISCFPVSPSICSVSQYLQCFPISPSISSGLSV